MFSDHFLLNGSGDLLFQAGKLTTLFLSCNPEELDARSHTHLSSANCFRINHVFGGYLIRSRNCAGNPDPCPWILPLSESCMIFSYEPHGILLIPHQHPFNKKENAFIVIMASAAANAALGTEVLAVQRLFYNITPNPAASILYVLNISTSPPYPPLTHEI